MVVDTLTARLSDPSWSVRERAATLLGELGETAAGAYDALWTATRDYDEDVRAAAATAITLVEPNIDRLHKSAMGILQEGDPESIAGAGLVINAIQLDDRQRDEVLSALWRVVREQDDPRSYQEAFKVIAKVSGSASQTIDSLESSGLLTSSDLPRIVAALQPLDDSSLSEEQYERIVEILWSIIRKAPDSKPADDAFKKLVQGPMNASRVLAQLLNEPSLSLLRKGHFALFYRLREALEERWNTGRNELAPPILAVLEDPHMPARRAAIDWLADRASDLTLEQQTLVVRAVKAGLGIEERGISDSATSWLAKNAQLIPQEDLDDINRLLTEQSVLGDRHRRSNVEAALARIKERLQSLESSPWFDVLQTGEEDAQIKAIDKILEIQTREAIRELIREWTRWISYGGKAVLVEKVSESLRTRSDAVRPLVDQLEREWDTDELLLGEFCKSTSLERELAQHIRGLAVTRAERPSVERWLEIVEAELDLHPKSILGVEDPDRSFQRHARETFEEALNQYRVRCQHSSRERIARQLADMSDERFHDATKGNGHDTMVKALQLHAVPALSRVLTQTDSLPIRESLARALGNAGGREAVEALTRAVIGEERTQTRRRELLAKYYLDPSKQRGEEAASILRGAVKEAKLTLRILQMLNAAVFVVGLVALGAGLAVVMFSNEGSTRLAGAFAGLGGFFSILLELIRNPIAQIQNAMTRLVQIETAFTSFIWELNLNGTYIQSQYVARGVLTNEEIGTTVSRIEDAMSLAMNLVATYTEEQDPNPVPQLSQISPAAGEAGTSIVLRGANLQGSVGGKAKSDGVIAVDHRPIAVDTAAWTSFEVRFVLPDVGQLEGAPRGNERTIWLSLFVGGYETNALPFTLITV
jgi:HEAT repeat protein